MRHLLKSTFPLLTLFVIPAIACAQGGCVNSPENPTVILALVGASAGACRIIGARRRSAR
jgi:XrtJ-associated TM-motif-TM protein